MSYKGIFFYLNSFKSLKDAVIKRHGLVSKTESERKRGTINELEDELKKKKIILENYIKVKIA